MLIHNEKSVTFTFISLLVVVSYQNANSRTGSRQFKTHAEIDLFFFFFCHFLLLIVRLYSMRPVRSDCVHF